MLILNWKSLSSHLKFASSSNCFSCMPISLSISSPATSNFDLLRFLLVSLEVAVACANRFDWFDCESVLTEHDAIPSSEVLTERLD